MIIINKKKCRKQKGLKAGLCGFIRQNWSNRKMDRKLKAMNSEASINKTKNNNNKREIINITNIRRICMSDCIQSEN